MDDGASTQLRLPLELSANAEELGLHVVTGGARVTGLEVVAAPVANAVEMLDEEAHTRHQRLSAARGDTVALLLAVERPAGVIAAPLPVSMPAGISPVRVVRRKFAPTTSGPMCIAPQPSRRRSLSRRRFEPQGVGIAEVVGAIIGAATDGEARYFHRGTPRYHFHVMEVRRRRGRCAVKRDLPCSCIFGTDLKADGAEGLRVLTADLDQRNSSNVIRHPPKPFRFESS
jgi:hypothetical protein